MSAEVELQNVSIAFGNFYAAKNVNVKIGAGEFLVFLVHQVAEKQLYYERFQVFLNRHRVKY